MMSRSSSGPVLARPRTVLVLSTFALIVLSLPAVMADPPDPLWRRCGDPHPCDPPTEPCPYIYSGCVDCPQPSPGILASGPRRIGACPDEEIDLWVSAVDVDDFTCYPMWRIALAVPDGIDFHWSPLPDGAEWVETELICRDPHDPRSYDRMRLTLKFTEVGTYGLSVTVDDLGQGACDDVAPFPVPYEVIIGCHIRADPMEDNTLCPGVPRPFYFEPCLSGATGVIWDWAPVGDSELTVSIDPDPIYPGNPFRKLVTADGSGRFNLIATGSVNESPLEDCHNEWELDVQCRISAKGPDDYLCPGGATTHLGAGRCDHVRLQSYHG